MIFDICGYKQQKGINGRHAKGTDIMADESEESSPITDSRNPIHVLQSTALRSSGLSYDEAFELDMVELKRSFGELNTTGLVESFYTRVLTDDNELFRYS